jgi:hypothetical protein
MQRTCAEQGKSFLLNCLMGEDRIFKISNSAAPCTEGIDIANTWMTLASFSKVDGGNEMGEKVLRIGFVDAEGQGDKAVEHDARVCCPVLLTSKCVIFNWKGGVQKDDILSKLGIMTRAAASVQVDISATDTSSHSASDTSNKQFGHLHIIFRDWNSEESDPNAVYELLFAQENEEEEEASAFRNQIRKQTLESFESVRVWLFAAPNDNSKVLRKEMGIADLSDEFRQQLREFRNCLSLQLVQPKLFANMPLTGKSLQQLMLSVVSSLNEGRAVIPSGVYQSMLASELNHVLHAMEQEMRLFVTNNITELRTIASRDDFKESYLPAEDDALMKCVAGLRSIEEHHDNIVRTTICDESSAVGRQLLAADSYLTVVSSNRDLLTSYFTASYRDVFGEWMSRLRGQLKQLMDEGTARLLKAMDEDSVEGKDVDSIDKDLADLSSSLKLSAGGERYFDQRNGDVREMLVELDQILYDTKRSMLIQRLNEKRADADAIRIAKEIEEQKKAAAQAVIVDNKGCCF